MLDAAAHTVAFSFAPRYWFEWDHPTFGSLFTLLLPLLLVLGRAPRLWLAVGIGWGTLFCWAGTFPVDRNLQVFAPLLAAATGALLVRGASLGRPATVGLGALVALQLTWGAEYFFSGTDRLQSALALIRSGLDGAGEERYQGFRADYVALGRWLPEDAVVLLHTQRPMLGIDRPVLLDWAGFQGLIDYRPFRNEAELAQHLLDLGVTHLVWREGGPRAPSEQADVLFYALVAEQGGPVRRFGALRVAPLGNADGEGPHPLRVVVFGAPGYDDGIYPVQDLSTIETLPPDDREFAEPRRPAPTWPAALRLAGSADALVLGREAPAYAHPPGFREVSRIDRRRILLRRER